MDPKLKLHKASLVKALVDAANIHGHNVADPKKCAEARSWTDTMYDALRHACKHINANRDRPNRPCPKWMEEFSACPGEQNREEDIDRASEANNDGDEHGESEEQESDEEESSEISSDSEEEEEENADGDKEEGDEEEADADTDKTVVSKKPAAVCKRPAACDPKAAATEVPKSEDVEYSYGFDVEKSLSTRRERNAPRAVPDELAVSMKEPKGAQDSDPMIGVFKDGSEVECAQYTVAMHHGLSAVAKPKKMPKGGRKPSDKFFKKEWPDGVLEVALKDNTYRDKPPQRLVLLRGPSAQIIQLDCKYWLVDKALKWEYSDAAKRKHAETEATKWMTEVAEQLYEGKLDIAGVQNRKKDLLLQQPASSVPAKKMPKKKAAPKPADSAAAESAQAKPTDDAKEKMPDGADEDTGAKTADDAKKQEGAAEDTTATTDGAKQQLVIKPRQKRMPRQPAPAGDRGVSTPPAACKRSSSPTGDAPASKRPTIAPPEDSSDSNLD